MSEQDPKGLDQHEAGAKLDAGKIRTSLLKRFGLALMAVADLATTGAEKYTAHGWAEVDNGVDRYDDAAFGHWLKEMFEDLDPDTKIHHEVCVAWNSLAKLELLIEKDKEWKERLLRRESTLSLPEAENKPKPTGSPNEIFKGSDVGFRGTPQ